MTDLRALLGDKYDDVMQAACGCSGTRLPHCYECSDSTWDHECPGPVPCTHRAAGAVLAAVLPDLLAEASTRAEDAEAKARRFANLLGNNAKALNDVLPREVLRQKAEAWDEGHRTPWKRGPSGCDCFAQSVVECGCGRYGTGPLITPNPYRTEANRG